MKLVALEEHMATPALQDAWGGLSITSADGDDIAALLNDIGEERLRRMDDEGVDVQVLSLGTPGMQDLEPRLGVELARSTNDVIADAVAAHPDRFQGFAALPVTDPDAAAAELRRAVSEQGLVGALLNGRAAGDRMHDHAAFEGIFATAAELRVPLYLHPRQPHPAVESLYYRGVQAVTEAFEIWGVGWYYESGIQLFRLIFSGLFDRYPDLQVIIGHWGDAAVLLADPVSMPDPLQLGLRKPIERYLRENVYVTGSGIRSHRALRWSIEAVGADRVMFATDYPWVRADGATRNGGARRFLTESGLPADQIELIAHKNWDALVSGIRR
ncbi:amidohydrolase family protein [Microbacterium atlanticum]|uniref:amidohydrolase family protein n=1 Tax=Microbacterium atlanticum TaxID=2782168 RepID=UPI0018897D03|nr:amidohydrolase family protein [Microbacterium atlanticum]